MAIFKQKEFSSLPTKTIFKSKQLGNKVTSALKLAPKKGKIQIARESINLKNNLRPSAIKSAARNVMEKPGHYINRGVEYALSSPAGAAAYGATAVLPVPSSLIAIGVETGARRIPGYEKLTRKVVDGYRKSGIPEKLNTVTGYGIIK